MSAASVHHTPASHLERVEAPGSMLTKTAAKALAVLRDTTGFGVPVGVPGQDLRARLLHPVRQGLDQRRLADQGLPELRRRRPVQSASHTMGRHLVG